MSAEKHDFEEVPLLFINPVLAPGSMGLMNRYGHVVIKNRTDGMEIAQTDSNNKTQNLILHVSQLEKLKAAIEQKLKFGEDHGN